MKPINFFSSFYLISANLKFVRSIFFDFSLHPPGERQNAIVRLAFDNSLSINLTPEQLPLLALGWE